MWRSSMVHTTGFSTPALVSGYSIVSCELSDFFFSILSSGNREPLCPIRTTPTSFVWQYHTQHPSCSHDLALTTTSPHYPLPAFGSHIHSLWATQHLQHSKQIPSYHISHRMEQYLHLVDSPHRHLPQVIGVMTTVPQHQPPQTTNQKHFWSRVITPHHPQHSPSWSDHIQASHPSYEPLL